MTVVRHDPTLKSWDAAIQATKDLVRFGIAELAIQEHLKIMGADPRPLQHTIHVDGVKGASEKSVKPNGVIVYDYNRLDIIAADALDLLRRNSPVKSGRYVQGHRLFINQKPVENLKGWKPGDEVSISNTVPYSRVIEVGRRGQKVVKFSMPPKIYFRVAQALRNEYRDTADIQFTFRAVLNGAQVDQLTQGSAPIARHRKGSKSGATKVGGRFADRGGVQAHNQKEVRWPTITINPAGSLSARAGLR